MKREDPPAEALAPARRGKFEEIATELSAQPGAWHNITEDIAAEDKGESYFKELARSIREGNRSGFTPKGTFEAKSLGTQIWARAKVDAEA